MENIESFKVNHLELHRGLYVSRVDNYDGHKTTTIDIRVCRPYEDAPLPMPAMHTIEHLGATFLRKMSSLDNDVIYFGPMGCQTGFYLILNGEYKSFEILPAVKEMFKYIANFEGALPGGTEKECGNCYSHDLKCARTIAHKFFNDILINPGIRNLNYQK